MQTINQGVVLPVKDKKSDKSPDFRVTAKVGEQWVEIAAAWKKSSEKGSYLSLKFGDHVTVQVGEPSWKKKDDTENDFATLTTPKAPSAGVNPADVPF